MGETFGIDPLLVLDERDPARFAIRIAAYRAVQNDREREANRHK